MFYANTAPKKALAEVGYKSNLIQRSRRVINETIPVVKRTIRFSEFVSLAVCGLLSQSLSLSNLSILGHIALKSILWNTSSLRCPDLPAAVAFDESIGGADTHVEWLILFVASLDPINARNDGRGAVEAYVCVGGID